jgi:single-stranded-DNA-specific exonuclease
MNLKLLEYLKRYDFQPNKYSSFFSNYTPEEFVTKAPYLVDIEHFNSRLKLALAANHRICIYSDYDADAITATATMYWGLISLGFNRNNITYYAPDRFTEGYGINPEAIRNLAAVNDLIISVDCGINSVIEASICLESNCDLIITDHHVLSGQIPQALAVINPRLTEEYQKNFLARRMRESNFETNFPNQTFHLPIKEDWVSSSVTGVGVAWFCLLHLANHLNVDPANLNLLLPFVAIGTIADCQSIRDSQNRILVKAGIKMFKPAMNKFPGLRELVSQAGVSPKIDLNVMSSQDLGYLLAPILNAAGRIDHANLAINLLCTNNLIQAQDLGREIVAINQSRKELVKEAIASIDNMDYSDQKLIFLITDYSKGIVGLIASRLTDKFNLPCVVVSQDEYKGIASASLRAPKGYNMVEVMKNINPKLLLKFGGHPEAAGFSCYNDNCEAIKEEFESILAAYTPAQEQPIEYIPSELDLPQFNKKTIVYLRDNEVNNDLFNDVFQLEPFGQDFQMPKFLISLNDYSLTYMGQFQNHARISMKGVNLVYFNVNDEIKTKLNNNERLFATVKLNKNVFNSNVTNQLVIDEVQ